MQASLDPVVEQPRSCLRLGVPEIGDHVHAAILDLCGLRVLVLVDHVLVDRVGHQLAAFRFDHVVQNVARF